MTDPVAIPDPVPNKKKPVEPVADILAVLTRRRNERGVSIVKMLSDAGLGSSTWDGWRSGRNNPGLVEIDACARALGARVAIVDAETNTELSPPPPFGTTQSVEISGLIDALDEEHRETIRETVYRMAKHFADIQARRR